MIDSFGQYKDLPIDKVYGAKKMGESQGEKKVHLPPRIIQGLRINFDWPCLSSRKISDNTEQASPIAGWVLPEHLEQKVLVFDSNGRALGSLSEEESSIDEIEDLALRGFCSFLKERGIESFLAEIRAADEYIEPHTTADGDFMALLFGKPLAVAHARIGLQLQGAPYTSVTWDECWNKIINKHAPFSDDGYPQVDIRARIGEHHQLNDGVIWYWQWSANNDWTPEALNAPQKQGDDHINLKMDSSDIQLGLLLHPQGKVHVTTGILPVKATQIPVEHIQDVMSNMQGNMHVGPLLTPGDKLTMPLPLLTGHEWKWVSSATTKEPPASPEEQQLTPWQKTPWRLPEKTVIREGELQIEEKKQKKN